MKKGFLFLAFLMTALMAQSQNILGTWRTVDDETGETKSNVQLYEENGKVYGKVIALLRKNVDPNRVCDKCTDWRKGQKIVQMVIVRDLTKSGETWKGGKILDPEKGKEYSCTMWLEGGNLKVRGWIGPFFRTQTWYKAQ
jgi:uncharacterized protein (DUF2147 family)